MMRRRRLAGRWSLAAWMAVGLFTAALGLSWAAPAGEAGFPTSAFTAGATERGDDVQVEGCSLRTEAVGAPDLPVQIRRLIVPLDFRVTGIAVTRAEYEPLEGTYAVAPADPPTPTDGSAEPKRAEPDPAIYGSDKPFPETAVEIATDGYFLGYHIVTLHVHPVHYRPASGRMEILAAFNYELIGETAAYEGVLPERRSELTDFLAREAVTRLVDNPGDVAADGPDALVQAVALEGGALEATEWPSPEGPPADFVIITDQSLVGTFEPLRFWKQSKGWVSVTKSVQEIVAHYPGVDTQERIRAFIIDAGEQWGTLFFLLGGDVNYVPARMAVWDSYGQSWGPTDLYYATIGTWDPNGNGIFGEDSEYQGCDYEVDFHVGRAPVENATEAQTFVNKVLAYEKDPPLGFAETALFMGASIGSGSDTWGQSAAESIIADSLPAWFDYWRLYNILWVGDELLTRQSALTHLNQGYHYIYHADHSSPSCMGTGYTHGGGTINSTDASGLTNGSREGVLISLGCSPNAFDYDSISERFVNNPNGGLVAYMGNTRTGWSSQTPQARALYREIFVNHVTELGHAFSIARSELSGWYFYYRKVQNLLGDPSMELWTMNPTPLEAQHPASLLSGPQNFTVRVTNPYLHPIENALVALYKQDDVYVTGLTGPDGRVTLPVNCQTYGQLAVTASATDYLPVQHFIPAGPPISGTIHWPNGEPAPYVSMKLLSLDCHGGPWTTMTDANGFYKFEGIPAGIFEVRAERRVNCTTYRRNVCSVHFDGSVPVLVDMTLQANGAWLMCPAIACDEEEERGATELPFEYPAMDETEAVALPNLQGTVYWNCGSPHEVAPYVTITARRVGGSGLYSTTTSLSGAYTFSIPSGWYHVTASIRSNGVTYRAQRCNVYVPGSGVPAVADMTLTTNAIKPCIDVIEDPIPDIEQQ